MKRAMFAVILGCSSASDLPTVRFANAPPVLSVDDRLDVPRRPDVYVDLQALDGFEADIERPLTRGLELPRQRRALGVNSLDDVPDSTWFTNRIGIRDLTADDIGRGPLLRGGPEDHKPWTVHSTNLGGGPREG